MGKYDLLSIKCKMCEWQSEITTQEKKENLICEKCGSKDLKITKKTLHMLKKGGKFITDVGFSTKEDIFNISYDNRIDDYQEPLLIVKKDSINISDDMTDDELKELLSEMNQVRNKILDKIELDKEDLLNKLYNKD